MTVTNENLWFYAKSFGIGWFLPAKWQGWVVYVAYTIALLGIRPMLSTPYVRTSFIVAATALLIAIVVWKGERPVRWRWGGL
ncbi:MAG: hypothetical protein ACI88G_001119 [Woeseiaceae bacterium]|jgi:hypothetical protein